MTQLNDYTPKKIGNFNIPKSVIECKIDTLAILELLLRKNIASWEEIDEIREAVVLHLNVMFPELQLTYSTPTPMKDEAPFTPPEGPAKPLFYSAPPPEVANMNTAPSPGGENKAPQAGSPTTGAPPASTRPPISTPLYQNMQPPKINSAPRPGHIPVKPVNQPPVTPVAQAPAPTPVTQEPVAASTENADNPSEAPVENTAETKPEVKSESEKETVENPPAAPEPAGAPPKANPLPGASKPMMPNAGPPKIFSNPPRKKI